MRKVFIILLSVCLLFTCFTACQQQETPTPTDSATKVEQQSTEEQNKAQPEKESQEQQQAVEQEDKTTVVNKDKSEKTQIATNEKDSNKSSEEQNTEIENIHAEIHIEYPNFTSFQAYEQWIKTGSGYFDEERSMLLTNVSSNQEHIYIRPIDEITTVGSLVRIDTESPKLHFVYRYASENGKEFLIAHWGDSDDYYSAFSRDSTKQQYEKGKQGYYLIQNEEKDIDYYMKDGKYDLDNDINVYWTQFEQEYHASFRGYTQQEVADLIPLLKLEQVTVKLNNDHVTQ